MSIDNYEDMIDTRDVLDRIEELLIDASDALLTEAGTEELISLIRLICRVAEVSGEDPEDGAGLIRDSYFQEYAQDLADDIGAIDANANWPVCHIDWEAAADSLKMDYSSLEFEGVTYWVRS